MTRSVYDIAVSLGITAGVDPADDATKKSAGKFEKDYTKFLDANALKGARIGVARDFTGADPDVDWAFEAALKAMQRVGATLIDVKYPTWFLDQTGPTVFTLYPAEFAVQIGDYLKTTGPKYPKNLSQLIERAEAYNDLRPTGEGPNPIALDLLQKRRSQSRQADRSGLHCTPRLLDAHEPGRLWKACSPRISSIPSSIPQACAAWCRSRVRKIRRPAASRVPTGIGNLTGFPDLIVPVGFTTDDLPVTISFTGTAFTEPKLLALGYAYEQATKAIRRPVNTPALAGATIDVPSK